MSPQAQLATIVPAGTWLFDDALSTLDFQIDGRLGIKVLARCGRFRGFVCSDNAEGDGLHLLIDSASITTDACLLDCRLRTALDADRYPSILFETAHVERINDLLVRVLGFLWFRRRSYLLELAIKRGDFALEHARRVHFTCSGGLFLDPLAGCRRVPLARRIRFALSAYGTRVDNNGQDG